MATQSRAKSWVEAVTGSLDDKRRWRANRTRKKALPANYRTAMDGIERYLMYSGPIAKGEVFMQMNDDLLEMFEVAAANHTPIRDLVGDAPVEFADTFVQNYQDGQWIAKERQHLVETIDEAAGDRP